MEPSKCGVSVHVLGSSQNSPAIYSPLPTDIFREFMVPVPVIFTSRIPHRFLNVIVPRSLLTATIGLALSMKLSSSKVTVGLSIISTPSVRMNPSIISVGYTPMYVLYSSGYKTPSNSPSVVPAPEIRSNVSAASNDVLPARNPYMLIWSPSLHTTEWLSPIVVRVTDSEVALRIVLPPPSVTSSVSTSVVHENMTAA